MFKDIMDTSKMSEEKLLKMLKKDPRDISLISDKQQTENIQMYCVQSNTNLIIWMSKPTDKVKEYVLSKNPAAITDINKDCLTEEDWQIAIMHNADVLRKWWFVYDDGRLPYDSLWSTWLIYLSKINIMTLRYLKRNGLFDIVPLSIQCGIVFFLNKLAEEYLPNFQILNKIPLHLLAKITGDAKKGKFNEKAAQALVKLYKD
jgi:hypothetical protein